MSGSKKKQTLPTKDEILAARVIAIDEFGALDAEIKAFKPKVDRHKVLKQQIVGWTPADAKPEASLIYDGMRYSAVVSAMEEERAISDMQELFRLFGKQKFLALCSMTLKNCEANLTPAQMASIVTKARTGSRSVTALQRAAAAA